nr:hypothetical protein [uncultured Campylobacter sp.]
MQEKILSKTCGECEFEMAHTDYVGNANINGGRVGVRWSKTHKNSPNGYPTRPNGNPAYVVLPNDIARLLIGALLGCDDKNIASYKKSLFDALNKIN